MGRLRSLDVVRGLACVLMAIDHVRVYAGVPAGGPDPGVFFTRWVTHFVAPAFCFFAGTGAFFMGRKLGDMPALARFLIGRGLLLVLLELTVIRFTWTFNFDYAHYVLAGVIWMLGWCMVLLGLMVRLAPRTVGLVGLAIVAFQQLFSLPPQWVPAIAPYWAFLYPADGNPAFGIAVLYVLVPWIGVMATGYGFGLVMERKPEEWQRWCMRVGLSATALFVVVACIVAAVGPVKENAPPFLFRVLNQQKYPASQLFLLMTLGPAIAILPWADRARNWFTDLCHLFGRVPMFYYLVHIPAIHLAAMVVSVVRAGSVIPQLVGNFPLMPPRMPDDYQWSLGLLYLVWAVVVVGVLWPACRWYAGYKARHPGGWVRYI
ncbi:MAG: DUF1624 domain-containing protein [Gemmatimonadetes bacterium]|nr:DUF1624 domain-containing protein [Gemmatimonadota bacterium]